MSEMGADTLKSFTVVPSFGGYFRSVKTVAEFSPQKVILVIGHEYLTVEGEKLEVAKYFEGDVLIKGGIKVISIE